MDIMKALLAKSLRELLTNHSLPRSGQQTQATDIQNEKIKISINLPYIEGTSEKLWRILRCHKKRSTFYTESILRELLCKPKDRVATENKNNIVYEIYCSNS